MGEKTVGESLLKVHFYVKLHNFGAEISLQGSWCLRERCCIEEEPGWITSSELPTNTKAACEYSANCDGLSIIRHKVTQKKKVKLG